MEQQNLFDLMEDGYKYKAINTIDRKWGGLID